MIQHLDVHGIKMLYSNGHNNSAFKGKFKTPFGHVDIQARGPYTMLWHFSYGSILKYNSFRTDNIDDFISLMTTKIKLSINLPKSVLKGAKRLKLHNDCYLYFKIGFDTEKLFTRCRGKINGIEGIYPWTKKNIDHYDFAWSCFKNATLNGEDIDIKNDVDMSFIRGQFFEPIHHYLQCK